MTTKPGTFLSVFRFTYYAAACLCLLDAVLILASLPLADHLQISKQALIVSLIVAFVLFAAGFLVFRISFRLSNVFLLTLPGPAAPGLASNLRALLIDMTAAAMVFVAIMGLTAVAFLDRIRQGFAIFG